MEKTKFSLQVVINWELRKLNFKSIQLLIPFWFGFVFGMTILLAQADLELVVDIDSQSSSISHQSTGVFK